MAKEAEHPAKAGVDEREAVRAAQVEEFYAREANAKPTPTQAENDLAKVGALNIDEKEDDGSEWESDAQQRVMEERVNNPYVTSDMNPSAHSESKRGRPRKAE
jgi:hypothetical protein